MVDFINDRPANHGFLDALSFGYGFGKTSFILLAHAPVIISGHLKYVVEQVWNNL